MTRFAYISSKKFCWLFKHSRSPFIHLLKKQWMNEDSSVYIKAVWDMERNRAPKSGTISFVCSTLIRLDSIIHLAAVLVGWVKGDCRLVSDPLCQSFNEQLRAINHISMLWIFIIWQDLVLTVYKLVFIFILIHFKVDHSIDKRLADIEFDQVGYWSIATIYH